MTHGTRMSRMTLWLATFFLFTTGVRPLRAELRMRDICRLKGQEINQLVGVGVVVGLKGTGDSDPYTQRALAQFLQNMGSPVARDGKGQPATSEFKGVKNAAFVNVTARIPPEGVREGGQLDCDVAAFSAKSLEGGQLLPTALCGPLAADKTVYAQAQGPLSVKLTSATTGRVHLGCRMVTDVSTQFVQNDVITLVVDSAHASLPTAQQIEDVLNSERDFVDSRSSQKIAQARDSLNIEVRIPEKYRDNPVQFASYVLDLRLPRLRTDARVVIRERDGVIVIGEDVEIGAVAISHKNLMIQTAGQPPANAFVPLDPSSDSSTTRLQALVNALNALKVPTSDIADIIKTLESHGKLYAKVIVE